MARDSMCFTTSSSPSSTIVEAKSQIFYKQSSQSTAGLWRTPMVNNFRLYLGPGVGYFPSLQAWNIQAGTRISQHLICRIAEGKDRVLISENLDSITNMKAKIDEKLVQHFDEIETRLEQRMRILEGGLKDFGSVSSAMYEAFHESSHFLGRFPLRFIVL